MFQILRGILRTMTRTKLAAVIVALGAGISIWILTGGAQTIPTSPRSLAAELNAVLNKSVGQDSDKDGLFDWEENAIGANPQKPDTDGDGYLDGEEVVGGYSPLKPAPDDAERGQALFPRFTAKTLSQAATQRVARTVTEAVAEALSKKGKTGLGAPADVSQLVQGIVPDMVGQELKDFSNPAIDPAAFIIDPRTDRDARVQYLQAARGLMLEFSRRRPDPTKSEALIISEAIATFDFEKIKASRDLYQEAEKRLMALKVPASVIPLHQEIVTLIHIFGSIHQAISEFENDPLKTTLALQAYTQTRPRFERFAELLARAAE